VKAAEQFRLLVSQYPADTSGISNLALAYFYARNMTAALAQAKRALEIYPENLLYRDNYALYALYSGDYNLAIGQFRLILQKNPGFQLADLGLGMAYLANGQEHEAEQVYNKVANLSKSGASQAALARADLYAYQGDLRSAEDALEKGFGQDMAAGDKTAACREACDARGSANRAQATGCSHRQRDKSSFAVRRLERAVSRRPCLCRNRREESGV
jgi:tetratricopeptide (TPR) repeat protein